MALPIPFRVQNQGSSSDGPRGAIPISLYGLSGAGGPVSIGDVSGLQDALDSKVDTSSTRLPIVLTRAEYEALNPPVAGQVYIIQG
ncbi:hypothetical protein SEA_PLATTE_37 [Microbacterium phage Platte]|nr:hypothetical protein SEA_HORTUS1_37 [Microbacterium phage Hortus1]AWY05608.1 hypothetical protein SEA_OLINDD_37 [Microbacterium phage OlinDD]AWY05861.1 hypothetical protein SEA_PIONEER3_37 [Microbacterium phage Pioneer3]AWY06367.1 hypothetical protein SEA_TANDEM_37 [Microbacterium phage Tandem]QAU07370.1 hypothetical protein SEA_ALLEB_38 [Microbacterium phage Alleb]QZD97630.1 hypothetical protein SEA_PLATTE_37 [Microbacterium phage Platte]